MNFIFSFAGEFSQPDGGLSKFKQAVDRRTGKNYLLQYVNIGGMYFFLYIFYLMKVGIFCRT